MSRPQEGQRQQQDERQGANFCGGSDDNVDWAGVGVNKAKLNKVWWIEELRCIFNK